VAANGYIDYAAFRSALDDVRRRGIAPHICLPFAARPGQVVNIGGEEYRLQAPVADDGAIVTGALRDDTQVTGYVVTRV
jgi:hypothetical protein